MEKRMTDVSARALAAMVDGALQTRRDPAVAGLNGEETALYGWPHGELQSSSLTWLGGDEAEFKIRAERRYATGDFTRFEDGSFVIAAYLGVFERRPDAAGLAHYRSLLRAGRSKVEILGRLRYSKEGRRVAVTIALLRLRYVHAIALDMPLIGVAMALGDLLFRGGALRRSIRRLETHSAMLATMQRTELRQSAAITDRNLHLLEERIDAVRRR